MGHLRRSWFWIGPTALLCGVFSNRTDAQPPAPTAADVSKLANAAQKQARDARDRAEAMAKDFATPLATASAAAKADAESARQAAKAAADSAVATADAAVALANGLKTPPDPTALGDAFSAANSAAAAAERAEAAEAWARGAHEDAQAQVATAADAKKLVKQADDHRKEARAHEGRAADWDKKVDAPKDLLALRALFLSREADIYRNVAAGLARRVAAPQLPAEGQFFKIKDADPAKAPQSLGLTYLLSPRLLGFHVVGGAPEGSFKLTLVPKDRANPPPRITLRFTFTHEKSGTLTIPRNSRIRPLLDANGEFSLSDDDKKVLAHDFIRVLDEIDPTFWAGKAIEPHEVAVTIVHDDGFTIDTLVGWLKFDPKLINVR